jgi:hypothetical protein
VTPGYSIICGHLAGAVTVHWADRTLAQTTPVGAQWIVPGDEARRQDNPTQKVTNDDYKYTVAAHPYGTSASSCTTAFGSPPDGEFTTRVMNSPGLGPASISSSMEQAITSPKWAVTPTFPKEKMGASECGSGFGRPYEFRHDLCYSGLTGAHPYWS